MAAKAKTRIGIKICKDYIGELKMSFFYTEEFLPRFVECLEELDDRKITKIICYGLGTFYRSGSVAPRFQLALLVLIHELVASHGSENLSDTIEIYDPKFKSQDIAILESFESPKFHIIQHDELCARTIDAITLFFMPHLHRHLYHNLIGANWKPQLLQNLVIVGNSFREMICNQRVSVCKTELHYINLLVNNFETENRWPQRRPSEDDIDRQRHRAMIEKSLETTDKGYTSIFNCQAVHFFNPDWMVRNKYLVKRHFWKHWQPASDFSDDA